MSEAGADSGGAGKPDLKSDQTGTNPVNFQHDLRFYNEYQWLNTAGDGWQNISTVEFRVPFGDDRWSFRVRARANGLKADLNGDGDTDVEEFGWGDVDMRLLTVPYFNVPKRFALAVGLEAFLDPAPDDALGTGSYTLGPQVFLGFFRPFCLPIDGFFPGYQHQFNVGGNDVHASVIDLYLLKTFANKTAWLLLDPQIVIDYENDTQFMLIDAEVGIMLDKFLGGKGHSVYVRPGVGVGRDRPFDVSLEIGYKHVW